MLDAHDCRKQAAECLSLAETETHHTIKSALTNVGRSWSLLADQLMQLEALTDRQTAITSRTTMIAHVRHWLTRQIANV